MSRVVFDPALRDAVLGSLATEQRLQWAMRTLTDVERARLRQFARRCSGRWCGWAFVLGLLAGLGAGVVLTLVAASAGA